jgi:SAM-dependent methyltransferase
MTDRAWYEEAFGSHYLEVYAHRTDEAAGAEAAFAGKILGLGPGSRVLDLACGAGRHSRALSSLGIDVTGMDLSPELLESAGSRTDPEQEGPRYVRGDMRHLPFADSFDAVCQFFTSFGYFEDPREDEAVLREVARVLLPGGRFLFDYLNRNEVVRTLTPESVTEAGDLTIRARRRVSPDGRRVLKDVLVRRGGDRISEYTESVRLYDPEELGEMMMGAGLHPTRRYGDLAGGSWSPSAPRLVIVAIC